MSATVSSSLPQAVVHHPKRVEPLPGGQVPPTPAPMAIDALQLSTAARSLHRPPSPDQAPILIEPVLLPVSLEMPAIVPSLPEIAFEPQAQDHLERLEGEAPGLFKVQDPEAPIVQQHLSDLIRVPAEMYQRLRKRGLKTIEVIDGTVPECAGNSHLKGVSPRGWPEGKTWDQVAGNYNPSKRTVCVGNGEQGSVSLSLHELAHAIGKLLGYNNHPELIEAHKRLYPKLQSYFQQGGPGGEAGRQEFLAEALSIYLKQGEAEAVKTFDQPFVDFLKTEVLASSAAPH